MKKLRQLAIFGTLLYSLSIVGCTKDLSDDIDDLKGRVSSLEEQTKQINKDIADINDVVKAINGHEQVTDVKELADKSGYSITFSKDGKVTRTIELKHGSKGATGDTGAAGKDAPVIGTAMHPTLNVFCWNQTIDGVTSWLTDKEGNPIPLTGPKGEDGTASATSPSPLIGVDAQGYWTIDLQDGTGIKRMKDANNNDVKATGKDGNDGAAGPSGALGFVLSPDGRYAIFTISGVEYKFEISAITIGFGEYGIIYVEKSAAKTLDIVLPSSLKKGDFSALSAKIEGKNGGASDVVTRAATTAWQVVLTKPVYNEDGTIKTAPKVEITAPNNASTGDAAILTISLLDNNGNIVSSSRAMEIIENTNATYSPSNNVYTLNAEIAAGATKNVAVSVNANQTAAQTFIIPAQYTKANTPVITLKFADTKNFTINDETAKTLTIDALTYDGLIIIEGQNNSHAALVNSHTSGTALKVNATNATVIIQNILITGISDISVSPNTFVVRQAVIGDTKVTNGSVQIEKDATVGSLTTTAEHPVSIAGQIKGAVSSTSAPVTIQNGASVASVSVENKGSIDVQSGSKVTGTITSTSDKPVVISGDVAGKITSETSVTVNNGASTKEIASAGIKVETGAVVDGAIESKGTNEVILNGEVTGNVKVKDAANVTVGNEAKIGDASTPEEPAISAPNAPSVDIPNDAEINGPVEAPTYIAPISIGTASYTTVKAAVAAVKENETIVLAKGKYPLTAKVDESGNITDDWYCRIDKKGVTMKGAIGTTAADVILYGATYSINGNHGSQNLITIAETGITIEGITIMSKIEVNKTIEVLPSVENFALKNCKITPNTEVASKVKTGGSVYTAGNTAITIDGCNFEYARVRIGTGGQATIKNNTFKGGQRWEEEGKIGLWPAIELIVDKNGSAPTTATLTGNTFTDLWDWENADEQEDISAPINVGEGTLTMSNNNFPNGNLYWNVEKNGKIEGAPTAVSSKWSVDRSTCDAPVYANNFISFNTKTTEGTPTEGFYAWQGIMTTVSGPLSTKWEVETELVLDEVTKQSARTFWVNVYNKASKEAEFLCFGFIVKEDKSKGWYWNNRSGKTFLLEWDLLTENGVSTNPGTYKIKITNNDGMVNYYVNDILLKTETIASLKGETRAARLYLNSRNSVNTPYLSKWEQPEARVNL